MSTSGIAKVWYHDFSELVLHEIFERFAKMPYPSIPALVRGWNASNGMEPIIDPITNEMHQIPQLYFPLLPPEIDPRNVHRLSITARRKLYPDGIDDPLRRGWMLHVQSARRILSNIFYLGWVQRDGQIIRGELLDNGQVRIDPKMDPIVLHEPLVKDVDLFWHCFNQASSYTIDGLRNPKKRFYTRGGRQKYNDEAEPFVHDPWPRVMRNAETSSLLLHGKLKCGLHKHALLRHRTHAHEEDRYVCKYYDDALGHRDNTCLMIKGHEIDQVIVREFLERLQLTDEDIKGIARAWQNQKQKAKIASLRPKEISRINEIEQLSANIISAISLTTSEIVRQRLVTEIEKLQVELDHLQEKEQKYQLQSEAIIGTSLTPESSRVAEKTAKFIETLRTKWEIASISSRQALMQWIIEEVFIQPIQSDRKLLKGRIIWRGGLETPLEIVRKFDRRQEWDDREKEVMQLWYSKARKEDLLALLPKRSYDNILVAAMRMGINGSRSRKSKDWEAIPIEEMKRLTPSLLIESDINTDLFEKSPKTDRFSGEILLNAVNLIR